MNHPSLQTAQLHNWLERMRAGDLSAREELLHAYCNRLDCLTRKMLRRFPQVRRWTETDDVLQNALLRLLRSLQKVKPASVREFLGLAEVEIRRELVDLARHFYGPQGIGANQASHAPDSGETVAGHEPATPDDSDDLDRWQAFHEGVEGLSPDEREVVSLIFYHGWTQAEVAQLFQTSERTIRRRWQ
jgi:RNA polymerase sigma-70 factor (ECF subfamily)